MEVMVTRKYQVTIPEKIRKVMGLKIGDKLRVKIESGRAIFEAPKREKNPVEFLWNSCARGKKIDAVELVESSWK